MSENEIIERNFPARTDARFWICFALLLAAIFAFHGKSVPHSNELVYLLRLAPDFLPRDWTFSQAANEHWLFNFLFGLPARFLSLEIVGWLGRVAVWILCLGALLKLGRRWEISFWAISAAIFLWLAVGQSIVGGEWIFGGFEAKTVAYVCLLFALEGFARRKMILSAALLGLAFTFHPAVGLWAMLAVGAALVLERTPLADLLKIALFAAVCALPGVLATLLGGQAGAAAGSPDDWRFIVTVRAAWILDPFAFSRIGVLILFVMLAFNVVALWKSENLALRFLVKFQTMLAGFFVVGFVLRSFELFSLLRLMPTRLFPIFTFLFFLLTISRVASRQSDFKYKIAVGAFALLVVAPLRPLMSGLDQVRETRQSFAVAPDDLQKSFRWIAANAPPDALLIAPPNRRDVWFETRRATVVSFTYPTYDRLTEWRSRLADLTGAAEISAGEQASEQIELAFNDLTAEQIARAKNKYAATHLVSRAVYSYPIIFETGTYKVYRLE